MQTAVRTRIRRAAAAALALGALAAPASPAHAAGMTLKLSSPPLAVGHTAILQATGTMPVEDIEFPYWFSLVAIPASATRTCPADRWVGVQFTSGAHGSVVVLSQGERPDATGAWSIPVAITPSAAGDVLFCGYTDDGETNTLAGASLLATIRAAPLRGAAAIRAQALGEIRSCLALLARSQAGGCLRRAITRANARCRRVRPRSARPGCLRSIRRVKAAYRA